MTTTNTTRSYSISVRQSGDLMGVYHGATEAEALAALADDAGTDMGDPETALRRENFAITEITVTPTDLRAIADDEDVSADDRKAARDALSPADAWSYAWAVSWVQHGVDSGRLSRVATTPVAVMAAQ